MRSAPSTFLVCALCAGVAGCAAPAALTGGPTAKILPAGNSGDAIIIGRSSKADVTAALGSTTAVRFDSGFEVWVYQLPGREKDATGPGEFVILFAPSGIVAKTRIRAPAPGRS
jgi:hypothetical protein